MTLSRRGSARTGGTNRNRLGGQARPGRPARPGLRPGSGYSGSEYSEEFGGGSGPESSTGLEPGPEPTLSWSTPDWPRIGLEDQEGLEDREGQEGPEGLGDQGSLESLEVPEGLEAPGAPLGQRRGKGRGRRKKAASRRWPDAPGDEPPWPGGPAEDSETAAPAAAGEDGADDEFGGLQPARTARQHKDPEDLARQICLRLLSMEPRTRTQLAQAMERKQVPAEAAEAVLARFTEVGLIDDAAFARAWVESRHHGRGLARRALSAELRRKGVDPGDVRDAIETLDPEQEAATAHRLIAAKVRSTRGQPPAARARRLVGTLARKGYPAGLAYRVVRDALEADGAELAEGLDDPDPDTGPEPGP